MILKPFMLRRVKKDVQNELGAKIEKDVYCQQSFRQKAIYKRLRSRISVAELVNARYLMDTPHSRSAESTLTNDNLLNLVIQFRKVCNHPELFERAEVESPLFLHSRTGQHSEKKEGRELNEEEQISYLVNSSSRGWIVYRLPKMIYRCGGLLNLVGAQTKAGFRQKLLQHDLCIYRPDRIQDSLRKRPSCFAFLKFCGISAQEAYNLVRQNPLKNWMQYLANDQTKYPQHGRRFFSSPEMLLRCSMHPSHTPTIVNLSSISTAYSNGHVLSRHPLCYLPRVLANPPQLAMSDRDFTLYYEDQNVKNDYITGVLCTIPQNINNAVPDSAAQKELILHNRNRGYDMMGCSIANQGWSPMRVPHLSKLIIDSGKIDVLDQMLPKLKQEGHRCLIYFQMTKMMDLFEVSVPSVSLWLSLMWPCRSI